MDPLARLGVAQRTPAVAMRPVQDPAGWSPEDLADVDSWSYWISDSDVSELAAAVSQFRAQGAPIVGVSRENFKLRGFAGTLADIRRELVDGRGVAMLRGFPVDRFDREATAIAYLGLGSYLGHAMSQNKFGHVLGHVKNLGGDYSDPFTRGYMTNAEMRFHADACDFVGLLCLQSAMQGGASCVASSVTMYNRMLAQRPDLVESLCQDFYRSRTGEANPGEVLWFKQPIFSFSEGYFSATGVGAAIDKAQGLPGVPPLTPLQKEAIDFYRDMAEECAAEIEFRPGDIQFLNNFVMLHTRRAYEDWPQETKRRHLLRLWLSDPSARPIPRAQREGRSGQGVHLDGVALVAPLDVEAA
jgi:hypothetical protein